MTCAICVRRKLVLRRRAPDTSGDSSMKSSAFVKSLKQKIYVVLVPYHNPSGRQSGTNRNINKESRKETSVGERRSTRVPAIQISGTGTKEDVIDGGSTGTISDRGHT